MLRGFGAQLTAYALKREWLSVNTPMTALILQSGGPVTASVNQVPSHQLARGPTRRTSSFSVLGRGDRLRLAKSHTLHWSFIQPSLRPWSHSASALACRYFVLNLVVMLAGVLAAGDCTSVASSRNLGRAVAEQRFDALPDPLQNDSNWLGGVLN